MNINLYAKIVNNETVDLVMPDAYGEMKADVPTGANWYCVQWPLNPHFTGETAIKMMLNDRFPHRKPVAA